MNEKIVVICNDDIMIKYLQMRKIAISYWNIFCFTFGNIIFLPLLQKTRIKRPVFQIMVSCYLSYEFYRFNLKHFLRIFNNNEYSLYKEFCLKYKLEDGILF